MNTEKHEVTPGSEEAASPDVATAGHAPDKSPAERTPPKRHPDLHSPWGLIASSTILLTVFGWSYWPTLGSLVDAWDRIPDYSHGYLVVPLAVFFLWTRRDSFPKSEAKIAWAGLVLVGLALVARIISAWVFYAALDAWSILLWTAGVVWFFAGWRILRWSLPSIAFLWFMVPLPYRAERALSLPLQQTATKLSCWVLQCLGEPALAEGNTIHLGAHRLEVEQACSGLRIFVGILALAFAYLILSRGPWLLKALVFAHVVPVALLANSARIVCTGLLFQHVSEEAGETFGHDIAGWAMIPLAAGLFFLVARYLDKLAPEVEIIDVGVLAREQLAL